MLSGWGRRLGKRLMKARLSPGPEVENQRWNIVRGDNVEVIQGKSTGQKGKVLAVIRESSRLIIDGVNMVKNHCFLVNFTTTSLSFLFHNTQTSRSIKPRQDGTPGKKIMKPCPVHYSNVMLIDPSTG